MQQDWEIKKRAHVCTHTGKEFQKGELFYTLLFREDGGFRREDLCEAAWIAHKDSLSGSGINRPFSFWKSRYQPSAPPAPEPIAKKDSETVLRRLIAQNNPVHTNLIYILALLLERKRLLRAIESEDKDTLVYEYPATGEMFLVRNPHLELDQIPAIQREVADLLAQNL
ncbi:MAG: hypothetical protein C5B47_04520 [Verrucomicrobia bacterium]|nr:MAG: hypothetical protein C5B47_04520 [Verrucomicrobiota bacterium]